MTEPIGNESLENWKSIGSGGFGHVYKARHKEWGFDVAIKILRNSDCPHLLPKEVCKEAYHMEKASCGFVLRVYGFYQGCPPFGKKTLMNQGIVMEFMERGSVEELLKKLPGPPPLPLAFRLAHQVALGMNFLHTRNLIHQDLKPSNVLLTDDLNAKLADLGLTRGSASALNSNRDTTGVVGGSYKYMPPEAFDASYKPVRAYDIYSYGILLWFIITGGDLYPAADYQLVALRIPKGDRPPCSEIEKMKGEGLNELVDLMKQCWETNPPSRPTFKGCLEITENLLSKHKREIPNAVHQVLTRLESTFDIPQITNMASSSMKTPEQPEPNDEMDYVRQATTESPIHNLSTTRINDTEKAKFIDDNRAELIQKVSEVMVLVDELGKLVHGETYSKIEAQDTSQEKMRVLYQNTLRPGGVKTKAALYDALKKHQPQLVA